MNLTYAEQRALEILSHGHPGSLDTMAVNQLLTALSESTSYNGLAQSLQLHMDATNYQPGVHVPLTWEKVKQLIHKVDIDFGKNSRDSGSKSSFVKSTSSGSKLSKLICDFCGKPGHYKSQCPKWLALQSSLA